MKGEKSEIENNETKKSEMKNDESNELLEKLWKELREINDKFLGK